ncbi:MAG: hypothetical protein M3406_00265, partial [Chloroflexota bacterium]|nr:hypothetical protein [Chloroflexota bacterium]
VSPSGSWSAAPSSKMLGTARIARVDVEPDGEWEVESDGCTDVIWDTETSLNEGPDRPHLGPHDGCEYRVPHRHPDRAYDQFMTADGSVVLRRDVRFERWVSRRVTRSQ